MSGGECDGFLSWEESHGVGKMPTTRRSERPRDAELAHSRFERGPLESEELRGPVLPADTPAHALENRQDVLLFDLHEGPRRLRSCPGAGGGEGVVQLEPALGREDDGALDHVLQLADVAGP